MKQPTAADDVGFHLFGSEAVIKKWSPQLAAALAETGTRELRISGWDLPGLEPLVGFRDQITRIFVECDVKDASALSQMSALRKLSLREGLGQLDLARLQQLEWLSVAGDVPEFGNLSACRSLKVLSITNCGLRDLTPLSALAHLEELEVSEGPLKSFDGIGGMESLRRLVLFQLPLERLDGVERARSLRELVLGFLRRLRAIRAVVAIPGLKTLMMYSCGTVSDVEQIGTITTLESLELQGLPLPSVGFLSRLTQLRSLRLESVGMISSLGFLRQLKALEVFLPADNTTIEDGDLSILLQLPALREVRYTERRHYKPRRDEIRATLIARHGLTDQAS